MKAVHFLAAALAFGAFQPSRAQQEMPMREHPPAKAAESVPLVDGEVRKVDRDKGLIVLRHGDIPNLAMPPMTMGFDVADRKMLDGLKVGDKVRFQAEVVKGKATVTQMRAAP